MNILKSSSLALITVLVLFGTININLDYINCMKATKHSYISKAAVDHISSQCEAFIKEKVMVK